jgi:hypothetical protein
VLHPRAGVADTILLMAMYDADAIPTRRPIAHRRLPRLAPGDHVRINGLPGDLPAHAQLEGGFGRVLRVSGASVVIETDEPYTASGLTHRTFFCSSYQLRKVEPVGKMGARDLYDEEDEDGGVDEDGAG